MFGVLFVVNAFRCVRRFCRGTVASTVDRRQTAEGHRSTFHEPAVATSWLGAMVRFKSAGFRPQLYAVATSWLG